MSGLSSIGRIVPYCILKKYIIGNNPESAVLKFNADHTFPVSTYEIENGVWIVRSRASELRSKKRDFERKISDIDDQLEGT